LDLLPGIEKDPIQPATQVVSWEILSNMKLFQYVREHNSGNGLIQLTGREVDVTEIHYAGRWHLRPPNEKRAFWVDQPCIKQQNEQEKAHQMDLMRAYTNNPYKA
jgi:hypothetical protein